MKNETRTPILQRLKESAQRGIDNTVQYAADVATGKKLWEGITTNDGAVDGWIAHGANELTTVFLTGNAAPVYSRSLSPMDTSSPDIAPEQADQAPAQDQAASVQPINEIRTHQQAKAANNQSVTVTDSPAEEMNETMFQSSLGKLVDRIRNMNPAMQQEKELKI